MIGAVMGLKYSSVEYSPVGYRVIIVSKKESWPVLTVLSNVNLMELLYELIQL